MTKDIKFNGMSIVKKKKRRSASSLDKRKARAGWLFVLPFLLGFIFIYFPIIFDSIKLSFYTMTTSATGYEIEWAGLQNYKDAILETKVGSQTFLQALVVGLEKMIFDIPAIIIFSLFMAVLLNQKMAGRALFRAIFFVPVIISTGIMESIEAQNTLGGLMDEGIADGSEQSASDQIVSAMDIEKLFSSMQVGTELVTLVVGWVNNIFSIVNRSGVQMLIFLAGLQSISPAIYESCQIDGATAWETFWKITFPMISPMILVNAVYTVIDSFTSGSNTIMSFIDNVYDNAKNGQVISSAMSWMYFLIVILIVVIVAAICSAFVFYQRRND